MLDLDATDDPIHGHQLVRFFHGYYDGYCYLPLYIFCGEYLLCAKLRPSDNPLLAKVVAAWEYLPEHVRQAILTLVETSSGSNPDCDQG